MTDWEISLNNKIDEVKDNPEAIKKLVKEYINDFAEEIIISRIKRTVGNKIPLKEKIEDMLICRNINYNTELFYQY